MSQKNLSGPQIVSARAQEIAGCPHLNGDDEAFWSEFTPLDLSSGGLTSSDIEAEKVNRFALAKFLTDELAERLPHMPDKYPPYGLPELYRDPHMDEPDWKAVTELTPRPDISNTLQGFLASLNEAYSAKVMIHVYSELRDMHDDPQFNGAIKALSVQRLSNYHINTIAADEEAAERILFPIDNARDTILGIFQVMPAVFSKQYGRLPSHEEAIDLLRNSRRLVITPSLLDRIQLQAYLIGSTRRHNILPAPYGYDLNPDIFTIAEAKHGNKGLVMDYSGGLGLLAVQKYKLDRGDEGASYTPDVIIDETSPEGTLEELSPDRDALTCPARKFITAMWEDMLGIADQARAFEL
jgi:hypothetical protein